jgi:hypothetical protein
MTPSFLMPTAETRSSAGRDSLERTDPQRQVRARRVLHEHGHVHAPQSVGDFLHREGIHSGPRTDPQQIDAVLERGVHVLAVRDFRRRFQLRAVAGAA